MCDVDCRYAQFCVRLLVVDGALVALASLELDEGLELALCVLDDRCADCDRFLWDERVAAESVVARADFMDVVERDGVSYPDVAQPGQSEHVALCEQIFAADDGGDDVVRGLRAQ